MLAVNILISVALAFGIVSFVFVIYILKIIYKNEADTDFSIKSLDLDVKYLKSLKKEKIECNNEREKLENSIKSLKDLIVECHECECLVNSNTAKYKDVMQVKWKDYHYNFLEHLSLRNEELKVEHEIVKHYFCKRCWNEKQKKEKKVKLK